MKKEIIDFIAEIKIRLSVGQGLFYEFRNAVLIGASLKVLFSLSVFSAVGLTILALISFFIAGHLDLTFFKLYQSVAKLSTGKYNPFFVKLSKDVKKNGRQR